jgi:hypothetical protein
MHPPAAGSQRKPSFTALRRGVPEVGGNFRRGKGRRSFRVPMTHMVFGVDIDSHRMVAPASQPAALQSGLRDRSERKLFPALSIETGWRRRYQSALANEA